MPDNSNNYDFNIIVKGFPIQNIIFRNNTAKDPQREMEILNAILNKAFIEATEVLKNSPSPQKRISPADKGSFEFYDSISGYSISQVEHEGQDRRTQWTEYLPPHLQKRKNNIVGQGQIDPLMMKSDCFKQVQDAIDERNRMRELTTFVVPIAPVVQNPNNNFEHVDLTNRLNAVMPEIFQKLLDKGIDISNVTFIAGEDCSYTSIAKIDKGNVVLCEKMFNYNIAEMTSIIYHEYYHLRYDKPANLEPKDLNNPVNIGNNIPDYVDTYLKKDLIAEYPKFANPSESLSEFINSAYEQHFTRYTTMDPQYYENEIAAYEAETLMFPDSSLLRKEDGNCGCTDNF